VSDDAAGMRVSISKGIVGKAADPPFPTHHPVFGRVGSPEGPFPESPEARAASCSAGSARARCRRSALSLPLSCLHRLLILVIERIFPPGRLRAPRSACSCRGRASAGTSTRGWTTAPASARALSCAARSSCTGAVSRCFRRGPLRERRNFHFCVNDERVAECAKSAFCEESRMKRTLP